MKKLKIFLVLSVFAFASNGCTPVPNSSPENGPAEGLEQNVTSPGGFVDPQPSLNPNYRGVQRSETQKLNDSLNKMRSSQP